MKKSAETFDSFPDRRAELKRAHPKLYTQIINYWWQRYRGQPSAFKGLPTERRWPTEWLQQVVEEVQKGALSTEEVKQDLETGVMTEADMLEFIRLSKEVLK